MSGRLIRSDSRIKSVDETEISLNRSSLDSGIYLLKLEYSSGYILSRLTFY